MWLFLVVYLMYWSRHSVFPRLKMDFWFSNRVLGYMYWNNSVGCRLPPYLMTRSWSFRLIKILGPISYTVLKTAVLFKSRRAVNVVLYAEFSSEQVIQIHVLGALKFCSICFSCFWFSPERSCEGCFTFLEKLKLNIDAFNKITSSTSYSNVVFFFNNEQDIFICLTTKKTVTHIILNAEEIYYFCGSYKNTEIIMIMRPGGEGWMWIERQPFFFVQAKFFKSTRGTWEMSQQSVLISDLWNFRKESVKTR